MYGQINKLFILGNGFDLAHGLKTRYIDFINNFWETKKNEIMEHSNSIKVLGSYSYKDNILKLNTPCTIATLPDGYVKKDAIGYDWFNYLKSNRVSSKHTFFGANSSKVSLNIYNSFLERLSATYLKNWVDIEGHYYSVLKRCFRIQNEKNKTTYTVKMLNKDFSEISDYLEKYLIYNATTHRGKNDRILDKFNVILQPELYARGDKLNDKDNILLLNFNYTDIEKEYIDHYKCMIPQNIYSLHIHGELNNKNNPIIFGYGDELDEEYLKMESSNDDNYLQNIKSVKYMQTPNYRKLLDFLESYQYDVYIMGHSCGMSDRTLLNTIFEHKNCSRIKIFYYKREDGTDDHNEKIMNIYRNFKSKSLMRARVIDKTNCEPLV